MRSQATGAALGSLLLVAALLGGLVDVRSAAGARHPDQETTDRKPVVVEQPGSAPSLTVAEIAGAALLSAGVQRLEETVVGRVARLAADPGSPMGSWNQGGFLHQWPGVYATARFSGDAVIAAFDDRTNRYRITVDEGTGPAVTVARLGSEALLLSGLGPGPHVVRIDKVSGSPSAPGRFVGFFVPADGGALPPPAVRDRRIEFIGDSDSVGYGNAAPGRECSEDDVFWFTDTQASFGPRAARRLGADYHLLAASGAGLIRNYDGASPERTMLALEPRVLLDGPTPIKGEAWRPRVVVVALGSNDFTSPLKPGERWADAAALRADFEAAYVRLVRRLMVESPGVYVLMVAWDEYGPEYMAAHRAVLAALRTPGEPGRMASGAAEVDLLVLPEMDRSGCHWHPSLEDHEAAANVLVEHFEARSDVWND